MAAVGMLAPFTETLFTKFFPCLPKEKDKNRQGIVKAISYLSKSKGLANFFPENYEETLDALFSYRNKMFHNGFIWPENERNKFQERINDRGWPTNWFVETSYQDSRDKTGIHGSSA